MYYTNVILQDGRYQLIEQICKYSAYTFIVIQIAWNILKCCNQCSYAKNAKSFCLIEYLIFSHCAVFYLCETKLSTIIIHSLETKTFE